MHLRKYIKEQIDAFTGNAATDMEQERTIIQSGQSDILWFGVSDFGCELRCDAVGSIDESIGINQPILFHLLTEQARTVEDDGSFPEAIQNAPAPAPEPTPPRLKAWVQE